MPLTTGHFPVVVVVSCCFTAIIACNILAIPSLNLLLYGISVFVFAVDIYCCGINSLNGVMAPVCKALFLMLLKFSAKSSDLDFNLL